MGVLIVYVALDIYVCGVCGGISVTFLYAFSDSGLAHEMFIIINIYIHIYFLE